MKTCIRRQHAGNPHWVKQTEELREKYQAVHLCERVHQTNLQPEGLFDQDIIGGADAFMAFAWSGDIERVVLDAKNTQSGPADFVDWVL